LDFLNAKRQGSDFPRRSEGRIALGSVFVIEAWVAKRWRLIARSEYEVAARRLFERAWYKCPSDTLLRLRRDSEVLIKMPTDGLENVCE
jgi:hypothetical protein